MRAGILIIGSLLWSPQPHRVSWRNERLDIGVSERVRAPIRYGRESGTRGSTFTMVFSRLVARSDYGLGTALVIPCKAPVEDLQDLVQEAKALWVAESSTGKPRRPLCASWGAVGALFRPDSSAETGSLRKGWTHRISQERRYPEFPCSVSESACAASTGLLRIGWPTRLEGRLDSYDILLSTANVPTLTGGRYPTARDVAQRWLKAPGEEAYFFHNRSAGITTFQDAAIWRILGKTIQSWEHSALYQKTIADLELEGTRSA